MIRELTKEEYCLIVPLGKMLKDSYNISSIGPNERVFSYIDGEVKGFIQVLNLYETLEIVDIAVDKDYQRMGIGKSLLDYAVEKFRPSHILLEVRSSNEQAINFYKKEGFTEIRRIPNYYDGEDAIVMERIQL